MRIKMICQVCDTPSYLETHSLTSPSQNWETYELSDFEINRDESEFYDYEIWVCPDCLRPHLEGWDEEGSHYNWESVTDMINRSLHRKVIK